MSWLNHTHLTPAVETSEATGGKLNEHRHASPWGPIGAAVMTDYKPDTHYHLTPVGPLPDTITGEDMSFLVFPQLPGIEIGVTKEPYHNVLIQDSLSGRELRSTHWTAPRYRYTMKLAFLRQSAKEVETVLNYIQRHFGELDSFLIVDPTSSSVTNHGFGVGDGSTTEFQLQRCDEGYTYDAKGGPYKISSLARWNLVKRSEALTTSPWSNSGSFTTTTVLAPDNNLTALQFNGTGVSLTQSIANLAGTCTFSVWLKAASTTSISVSVGSSSTTLATTPTWTRHTVSFAQTGTQTLSIGFTGTVAVWGAMIEFGSEASEYIATTTDQLAQFPYYWPDTIGGFEPVYAPANEISIYVNTALQAQTAYSISATGLVTFDSPPADSAQLAWTGSYYTRVRFDGTVQLKRVASGYYEAEIKLVSLR